MIIGVTMFKIGLGFIVFDTCPRFDGPTGYEMNNWGQCFAFMIAGLFFGVWGLMI